MKESLSAKKVLTFGVTMTIGEYAIVPALSRFVKLHPDTDFHIRYGNTQTLLSALHEGTIDFAIVEGYFQKEMYETRVYRTEEYIAVASGNHHFTKSVHTLSDLTSERLLVREPGSGTRAVLAKTLALKNMSIRDFAILSKWKISIRSFLFCAMTAALHFSIKPQWKIDPLRCAAADSAFRFYGKT